jgi:hypothetical protein
VPVLSHVEDVESPSGHQGCHYMVVRCASGHLADLEGGYASIFGLTAALYFSSFVTFLTFMKGQPVWLGQK